MLSTSGVSPVGGGHRGARVPGLRRMRHKSHPNSAPNSPASGFRQTLGAGLNGSMETASCAGVALGARVLCQDLARVRRRARSATFALEAFIRMRPFDPADGAVPGGREAAPDQDDLHELLRAERNPRDALPEVPQHRAPPEGEGSPEGVGGRARSSSSRWIRREFGPDSAIGIIESSQGVRRSVAAWAGSSRPSR